MLIRFVIIIATLFVSCLPLAEGADYNASFDCTKAISSVEKLVCEYPDLATLDVTLSQLYQMGIPAGRAKDNVIKSQRLWLRDVRNKCKDKDCIEKAYKNRINVISRVDKIMPLSKREYICSKVTGYINDGSIKTQFVSMRDIGLEKQQQWINTHSNVIGIAPIQTYEFSNEGKYRTLGLMVGGGTCGNCDIFDMSSNLLSLDPEDDAKEHLRWASWGMCDDLMFVDKDPIIVTGRFSGGRSRATLVSWIAPDGIRRPLCYLDITGERKTELLQNENADLCNSVLTGQTKNVIWHKAEIKLCERYQTYGRAYPSCLEKDAIVDINNDGKEERVGFFGLDSGAGCGARYEWLRQLSPDGNIIENSIIDNVLRNEATGPIPGIDRTDMNLSLHIMLYNGKSYIFSNSHSGNSARLFYISNNEIKSLCEYNIYPQHTVKMMYGFE